jgi:hypothetical protein
LEWTEFLFHLHQHLAFCDFTSLYASNIHVVI